MTVSRIFILPVLALFLSWGLAAAAAAQAISLGELSRYLNSIDTAEAQFTQINGDGTISTGKLFIDRPGRVRFEYDPPDRSLVMAGGGQVAIFDPKSNQPPTQYPLRRTPLSIILAERVDLTRARMVTGHTSDGTTTSVVAQDPDNPEYGYIELIFTAEPTELRQWKVTDSGGGETTVILGDLSTGMRLPPSYFNIVQEAERRAR